jgi:hypothetical protein
VGILKDTSSRSRIFSGDTERFSGDTERYGGLRHGTIDPMDEAFGIFQHQPRRKRKAASEATSNTVDSQALPPSTLDFPDKNPSAQVLVASIVENRAREVCICLMSNKNVSVIFMM